MKAKAKSYKITAGTTKVVRDAASVKFHVASNDYFGTAATLVRLICESLVAEIKKAPDKDWAPVEKAFKNLENDLKILQKNYHISANKKNTQVAARGRLKSQ